MKSTARVVVIGGGIAGCSTLYHLAKMGWADVILLERDDLTSGTTWHSAAQVTQFGTVQTMVGLKRYSTQLYSDREVSVLYLGLVPKAAHPVGELGVECLATLRAMHSRL